MSTIKGKAGVIVKIVIAFVAVILVVTAVINVYVIMSTSSSIKDYEDFNGHYDYIIVLGC